jgi:hypothetical protein
MPARMAVEAGMADGLGSLSGLTQMPMDRMPMNGMPMDGPIRRMKDMPGQRVQMGPMDEEELEEDTEETEINNDSSCTCPPGTETCTCGAEEDEDEGEGTEQEPDESSIPKGEGDLITPTADRQRIAAILTCEEARGREGLARTLALETNHTLEAAKKLLGAAPAAATEAPVNALDSRMTRLPNPNVGVPGDAGEDDSPATEVQRILGFVPKNRLRAQVQ